MCLSKLQQTVKDRGAWRAAVLGGRKESDTTEDGKTTIKYSPVGGNKQATESCRKWSNFREAGTWRGRTASRKEDRQPSRVMKTTNPLNLGQGMDEPRWRRGRGGVPHGGDNRTERTTNNTHKQGTGTWRDRLGNCGALTVRGSESKPEQKPGSRAAKLLPHVLSGQGNTTPHPKQRVLKDGGSAPSRGRPPRRLLTVDSVRPPTDTASPSSTW